MARYQEITDALRQRLLRGELKPGERLPKSKELAALFNTSVHTINAACEPLVKDGFLERRRRFGTVVRYNPKVLTCAGIYCGDNLLDEWEFAFYRELCRELQSQLDDRQVEVKLFTDMRSTPAHTKPLPDLVQAVEAGKIQGLFVPLCDHRTIPWLSRLPVPKSFVTGDIKLNPVGTNGEQMVELALTRLCEQGCQTVGMISSVRIPEDVACRNFQIYRKFTDMISALGLKTHNDWVISSRGFVPNLERYGYDSFKQLWTQTEHPDGLLVFPDTAARGVMTAALELGVRVPDSLKLVFHRNSGVDWHCPLPVNWVESVTARWAAEMIAQIRQQIDGRDIEGVYLPYRIC